MNATILKERVQKVTEATSIDGWQPIETAPKDMRPILVFIPGDWEMPCEWHIAFYKPRGKGFVLQDDDHLYHAYPV